MRHAYIYYLISAAYENACSYGSTVGTKKRNAKKIGSG